jgi:hypothetical protein
MSDTGRPAVAGAVGLCRACAHARAVVSRRGSTFWLCERATVDARFARYPRLPVTRCAGFAGGEGERERPPPPGDRQA